MTQRKFDVDFARALRAIKASLDGASEKDEKEIRRKWREEHGVIFVREYTVGAHVYRRRTKRR